MNTFLKIYGDRYKEVHQSILDIQGILLIMFPFAFEKLRFHFTESTIAS